MKVLGRGNEASDQITYQNKYGRLKLVPVDAYRDINSISSELTSAKENQIPIDVAEQVALITESRRIQLCVNIGDLRGFFVVHHKSAKEAAVCSVQDLEFTPLESAKEIILREAKKTRDRSFGYEF